MTSKEFKEARYQVRLTQLQLSVRLGVSHKSVINYEQAIHRVPEDIARTLLRLARDGHGRRVYPRFLSPETIARTLKENGWEIARCARALGVKYGSLYECLRTRYPSLHAAAIRGHAGRAKLSILRERESLAQLIARHSWIPSRAARELDVRPQTIRDALWRLMPREYAPAKRANLAKRSSDVRRRNPRRI